MEAAADQGSQLAIDELENRPKLPESAANVWAFFQELSRARSHNGFGPLPLAYADIDAWARLTKQKLDPWELSAILRLDSICLKTAANADKLEGQSE